MSRKSRITLLCLSELLFLAILWWAGTRQFAAMNTTVDEIADLRDPSPFRVALLGHLGKIELGMQGYLRSDDASLTDKVLQSRKDFEAALPEFGKQNPHLFPPVAVEEIKRAFGVYAQAVDHSLEANTRRLKARAALDQRFAKIIDLIDHHIRPLIRASQPDAEVRAETILNVENQARAWQQNLVNAWLHPSPEASELAFENDNRGATYLDRYSRMELLSRERKMQKEIRALWQANGDQARESFALTKIVGETEGFMRGQRAQVVAALDKFLPAMAPAELAARKKGYVRSMRMRMVFMCLLAVAGLISLRLAAIGIYRLLRGQPILPPRRKVVAEAPQAEEELIDTTLRMDLKGTVTRWSPAAQALYGYTAKEMRGKSISLLFESESEISRLYQDLFEAPQAVFETVHKTKSGQPVPVRIEFKPVEDETGRGNEIGLLCSPHEQKVTPDPAYSDNISS